MACVAVGLLSAASSRAVAQAPTDSARAGWRAWAFGRIGLPYTSSSGPALGSFVAGIAASRGPIVGMFRATANSRVTFSDTPASETQDYAVLAGARSGTNRLFLTGAVGVAHARPDPGVLNMPTYYAPAFDISAHAAYRVAGLAASASGVIGPASIRYFAVSLGVELGWFGR